VRDLWIVEALPTTEHPKYIYWPSMSAMCRKKRRKEMKESSWV